MMRAAIWTLALALALSGQSVSVHEHPLSADEINRRLADFKDTNSAREHELHALFQEAGCTGQRLTEQAVKHSRDPNVICVLPGEAKPGPGEAKPEPGQDEARIIVGGHFDFVNAGRGVVDNWSGCSLLPSLYQTLKKSPRRHTFVFIGFADEEKGLLGSHFYVHEMSKDDVRKTSAMVNLDSLGMGPTRFEMDRGDKWLAEAFAAVANGQHLPWGEVSLHQVGRSDSDSFQDRHVPALMIHSITSETFQILHTPSDQMAAMRLADYYDTYRLVAAYLAYLDVTLDAPGSAEK